MNSPFSFKNADLNAGNVSGNCSDTGRHKLSNLINSIGSFVIGVADINNNLTESLPLISYDDINASCNCVILGRSIADKSLSPYNL